MEKIPKISPSFFRHDNWDASAPLRFEYDNFLDKVVGWCEASRVLCRPREDTENVAILFSDGCWCHLNFFYICNECDKQIDRFDRFDRFDGLDKLVVEKDLRSEKQKGDNPF